MRFILHKSESISDFKNIGGGKATNMANMSQKGFPIPEWLCLTTDAYHSFIDDNKLQDVFDKSLEVSELSRKVREEFIKNEIPQNILDKIYTELNSIGLEGAYLAIRSSGLDEDSADHSFAGQFSSFLYQKSKEEIELSIKECWASAYTERALSYRIKKGLPIQNLSVGIVIQKMINSEKSGVTFSRNPIDPTDRENLLISASYGQCEGIVSGEIDTDEILVNRSNFTFDAKVTKKEQKLIQSETINSRGHMIKNVDVEVELQEKLCITDAEIETVSKLALKLEVEFEKPQDCEWAIENGEVYLVQTRPITTLPHEELFNQKHMKDLEVLWDNSNIVESYSGVTSPLTFSFASYAYQQVYIQFCEIMGVPDNIIKDFSAMFRNMLIIMRGRIYYNLINWYKLVLLLPGSSENKSFMNTMMGVRDGTNDSVQKLFDELDRMPKYSFFKKLKVNLMTLFRYLNIDNIISDFTNNFNNIYEVFRKKDYKNLSLREQKEDFHVLENKILTSWKAPIINDYLCMIFFGILKKLTEKWVKVDGDLANLQNDLLCGQGNLDSTEPTKHLMRLARKIDEGDEKFRTYALETDIDDLVKDRDFMTNFDEFLDKYGFRCANELKLEESDLHDDPSFAVNAVVSYIRTKSYSIEDMEKREKEIKEKAEKIIQSQLHGVKLSLYMWFVSQTRKAVKNRENLRFLRTKVFGVARNIFRGMGYRFKDLDLIDTHKDIFFLTHQEIIAYIEGRSLFGNMRTIIEERKAQFKDYDETNPPPDRFYSFGPAALFNMETTLLDATNLIVFELPESQDPNTLYGVPCCPGEVEGEVRVALNPKDATGLAGEILVTERTDPGWVPLYPSCSGLLIERGSLLSHSAVVARELGLPTIVGVNGGLIKKLESGIKVKVNAGIGEIKIIKEEE